jgi:hypothetical protein
MSFMKKYRVWILIALLLAGTAGLFLWSRVTAYLESEEFRRTIEEFVSGKFNAAAELEPLHWNGSAVQSASLRLSGSPDSRLRSMEARNLRVRMDWSALLSGAWRVEEFLVDRLQAEFGEGNETAKSSAPLSMQEVALLPTKFELGATLVSQADLDFGDVEITGAELEIQPTGTGWKVLGEGGKFTCPHLPPMAIESFQAEWADGKTTIHSSALRLGAAGKISASGKWPGAVDFEWANVSPGDLLGEDWSQKLDGQLSGSARMESGVAKGRFAWSDGHVRGFGILQQAAMISGRTEFQDLPISKATGDFEVRGGSYDFRNVVVDSPGLLRVTGHVSISSQRALNGELQLGLSPSLIQGLDGLLAKVFTRQENGFVWASVTVGGTRDAPTENLSGRLASAVGEAAMDAVKPVLQAVPEPARKAVDETINTLFDILGR